MHEKKLSILRDIFFPIGIVICTSVLVTLFRYEIVNFAYYGYLGVFVSSIAANSTVFLPAPSSAIVFAFASVYSPFWVAIIGGLGAASGELIGYFAGYSGRRAVEATEFGLKVQKWFSKYSLPTVFVLAFLPLPIFDLVGVLAGSTQMNVFYFTFSVIVGKVLKMFVYAYLGAGIIPVIDQWIF